MTATNFALSTLAQITAAPKGTVARITTTTDSVYLVGALVSVTDRGIRLRVDGKYITRKATVVVTIELATDDEPVNIPTADLGAPAAPLSDEAVDSEFAALMAHATEFGHGETAIEKLVEGEATAVTEAATAEAPVVTETAEAAPSADYDSDPIIGGRRLSEMKFAEVMDLAKQYKTPGRGVARIDALRDGVAKAISLEVGRLASAS